jgi:hypothetical protein
VPANKTKIPLSKKEKATLINQVKEPHDFPIARRAIKTKRNEFISEFTTE